MKTIGKTKPQAADVPQAPEVPCISDMGGGKAFHIDLNRWFGGSSRRRSS